MEGTIQLERLVQSTRVLRGKDPSRNMARRPLIIERSTEEVIRTEPE